MPINNEEINLRILLPQYFQEIKDFQELMNTEEIELKNLQGFMQRIYNNLFIQLADVDTIAYYEGILNIPVQSGDTLEFRRWRVLNRYRRSPPYTMPMLKELLNEMVGIGMWEIEQDLNEYYIKIIIKNGGYGILGEVQTTLLELIPAHIVQEVEQQLLPEPTAIVHYGIAITISTHYKLT